MPTSSSDPNRIQKNRFRVKFDRFSAVNSGAPVVKICENPSRRPFRRVQNEICDGKVKFAGENPARKCVQTGQAVSCAVPHFLASQPALAAAAGRGGLWWCLCVSPIGVEENTTTSRAKKTCVVEEKVPWPSRESSGSRIFWVFVQCFSAFCYAQ